MSNANLSAPVEFHKKIIAVFENFTFSHYSCFKSSNNWLQGLLMSICVFCSACGRANQVISLVTLIDIAEDRVGGGVWNACLKHPPVQAANELTLGLKNAIHISGSWHSADTSRNSRKVVCLPVLDSGGAGNLIDLHSTIQPSKPVSTLVNPFPA